MKRFTNRNDLGQAFVKYGGITISTDAMERLAAYEDSGLTPEEVMELAEIVRCKDCKYHSFDQEYERYWCNRCLCCMEVKENEFCGKGERL